MDFTQQDYNKLKKIGVNSLFELCLCVPKSYTNTTIIKKLVPDTSGALAVEIKSHNISRNILKILAYIPHLKQNITLIIFNYKPYHKKSFAQGAKILIYGKIQIQFGYPSIIQPKIIHSINTIELHFKIPNIKDSTLQELTQRLINQEALEKSSLPKEFIPYLLEIFQPHKAFIAYFEKQKVFPPKNLNALKFIEIYQHISTLSKKRRYFPPKFICNNSYKSFIESLPFKLTQSQETTIQTIAKDFKNNYAARRIIMGDVGCGKTMVILASVVIAYPYQSLLMVPTTVLALQIYEEAKKFLPQQIKIQCITSKEDKNKSLFTQDYHFIIGTQALLHRQIDSKNLALIMTDEQHRFGTNQRHYLEKMAQDISSDTVKKPHFLQFSATPIPRTLSMINANLIDFSFMRDLPYKKDITTSIISKKDFTQLFIHLKNEIALKHQCVIVYPLVEESDHLDYLSLLEGAPFWQKYFDKVFITSGGDKDKEEILERFKNEGDLLLATTLIEVGISLPRLSTIVIIAPERMGLATLHQLRGRVSRNGLKGYCFLYTNTPQSKRLEEFCNHLSGFDIAEIDLKYRNGGDLINGERQSGEQFKFFDLSKDAHILALATQKLG